MNKSLYCRLAFTNIKNNRKTYVPYILTSILTVMMFYVMVSLFNSNDIKEVSLKTILFYAVWIIAIFSVIFLFYTNSFLIKRRKKELAVYNILGMDKRHIAKMLLVETLIIAVVSIGVGIAGGIVFSKLMYLILRKMLYHAIPMNFQMSFDYVPPVLALFGAIFIMTLFYNLMQVQLANPMELLRGSSQGEKEPKTKWLLAIIGVVAIGIGYYIAITTESPIQALALFFVAVVCVIIGTYALFTAGSIVLLKILRKNKKFYYKTKHFTSVSGMIYRMKQNAAGLANICILSTMVLVMVSTTISLYAGMGDILDTRFPQDFSLANRGSTSESIAMVDDAVKEVLEETDTKVKNHYSYRLGSVSILNRDGKFEYMNESDYNLADGDAYEFGFIPVEDYNAMENKNLTLADGEVLVYDISKTYGEDTIQIGSKNFQVKKELDNMKLEKKNKNSVVPVCYIIVKDIPTIEQMLQEAYTDSGLPAEVLAKNAVVSYYVKFDMEGSREQKIQVTKQIKERVEPIGEVYCESREGNEESFYMLYGGLFFIGIYLGFMFLMATVLIIYYKQISEGYDDKERFQIMQKVGMSKKEVKRSIRSQILTVFYLPLAVAIIHIAVAFKVVTKLLAMLNLVNVPLFLGCTIATVIVFAIFYAIVYGVTAREYYRIVH